MPPTAKQVPGRKGEDTVRARIACPRCRRPKTLTSLPANFECADVICKFCGFLAQVKAVTISGEQLPARVLGAAWGPQHERILDGVFQPLFVVGFDAPGSLVKIDYVPAHSLQSSPQVFEPRTPLSSSARRAGWQGFTYNLAHLPRIGIARIFP